MRRMFSFAILLCLGACALIEPAGKRYVVFFKPSSAELQEATDEVLAAAADWAVKHPAMAVSVASYADTYGSEKANSDFTRLRAQVVIDKLVNNGVPITRIQRREVGAVTFQIDSQESRRVEITVGSP